MYDLHSIKEICEQLRLPCRLATPFEIEISLYPDVVFVFANLESENDTYLGFRDTPWHSHGNLMLMTGDSTYLEYEPAELLTAISKGDVVIATQSNGEQMQDRWLTHKDENLDLKYLGPGETLSVFRIAARL